MTTIQTLENTTSTSRKRPWAAYVLTGLSSLFMLMDATMHIAVPAPVVEASQRLGYPVSIMPALGFTVIACVLLYAIPRTSMLGAILLTGYLGGAVSTHVRVGDPFYFPFIIAALIWGGLYLREERLRSLVPFRTEPGA